MILNEKGPVLNWNGISYMVMMVIAILVIIFGVANKNGKVLLFTIPVLVISIVYLRKRARHVFLSPKICLLLTILMLLSITSDYMIDSHDKLSFLSDLFFGLFLALVSIITVRSMLRDAPELGRTRTFFVAFVSFCISVTLCELLTVCGTLVNYAWDSGYKADPELLINSVIGSFVGSLVACALFYLDTSKGVFDGFVSRKLVSSNENIIDEESRRNGVRELISQGESSSLEFKATLRTNLATGQNDARMEKACLKTIVAFLNSRGGTLLIGVTDSGETAGADVDSFEGSRDKMLLHLNHLIESRIGKEFLPFINYYIIDFNGAPVIRVDCRISDSPVFLSDGSTQIFYVRSGPSSIELHGMDMLRYASNNFGRVIKRSRILDAYK